MKILVVCSEANDGCSWYRGWGAWGEFALTYRSSVEVIRAKTIPTCGDVRGVDIVYIMRPATDDVKPIAQACKDFGVPLWVDYDDYLIDLPRENPNRPFFSSPNVLQNIKEYVEGADLVTVSTRFLREKFLCMNANTHVVPNAYDPKLDRFLCKEPRNPVVAWRGTGTHDRDVASVASELVWALNKSPSTALALFGCDPVPWDCSELIRPQERVMRIGKLDLMNYFKAISAIRPQVFIVPLADNPFNRSKSNIAALEATYAGAAVLAPDWEEWRLPGVQNYRGAEDFGHVLTCLINDPGQCALNNHEANGHMRKHWMLRDVNEKRLELAMKAVGL